MEDMARLALVEQNVRDADTFSKILYELLRLINHILDNPHDTEIRTIKNEGLKKFFRYEALIDYLKSIGFQPIKNEYSYPKENTLNNLRLAQAAIERKIHFCCGSLKKIEENIKSLHKIPKIKENLMPVIGLPSHNQLLQKIVSMFNSVLQYEDEDLQAYAREQIPLVTLQLMAVDDMREHQRKIKMGEIKGQDIPFDIALLKVLLSWYKHRFFSWVDAPPCDKCGGDTRHYRNTQLTTTSETCQLEIFRCTQCANQVDFPRYNNARTLLATRRGRCGEWANCFTLLCRALGYDARLVYSTSDHVWCEIWDYDSSQWLHCDPCECLLDAPLTYSHGWGKRLDYVLAFSRDDLQDVTWRYTTQHKEVLKGRTQCPESELMECIMWLRAQRQRGVSEARRRYLAKRNLQELATMLTERKPGESELHGRISGSAAWRSQRGELRAKSHVFRFTEPGVCVVKYSAATDKKPGESELHGRISGSATWRSQRGELRANSHVFRFTEPGVCIVKYSAATDKKPGESELHGRISGSAAWRSQRGELRAKSHVFRFNEPGVCVVKYSAATDKYEIENGDPKEISSWLAGAYGAQHVFRKVETDWKMVYIAREEGATTGSISWKLEAGGGCWFTALSVRAHTQTYEDGLIHWSVQLDQHRPTHIDPTGHPMEFSGPFTTAIITASLSGGRGDTQWQHAQLFRARTTHTQHTLHIQATTTRQ